MRWRWPEVKSTSPCLAAIGPLRLFATVRSRPLASARARWRAGPGRGSDGLPFASLRVPCDARVPGLWPNSLRSLRSLRSNRRPQVRARSALRARPGTLRFSAAPIRPAQAPPAALQATGAAVDASHTTTGPATGHPGRARRACEAEPGHKQSSGLFVPGEGPGLCARRGLQGPSSAGFGARARSALRDLTRCAGPTTVSAASGGSCASFDRLRTTGLLRAAQGSRSEAKTASAKRRALPGCLVAAPLPRRPMVNGRNGQTADMDH